MEYNTLLLSVVCFPVKNILCAESCLEVILTDRWSVSGEYNLESQNRDAYGVYCAFEKTIGYTYFSSHTTVSLNMTEHYTTKSHAKLRYHDINSNRQGEVKVAQINRFHGEQLGFLFNEYSGYNIPKQEGKFKYLYLGFVPRDLIQKNEVQGYKAENDEYTFNNCDGNRNCYFVFYFGASTSLPNSGNNDLSKGWITSAKRLNVEEYMDEKFYFPVEIHMGGCGALATTTGLGGVKGSLGLPFEIPPACQSKPCFNSGVCSEDGTAYVCSCLSTFYGRECQFEVSTELATTTEVIISTSTTDITTAEISTTLKTQPTQQTCVCPCLDTGLKWAYLANLNLTKAELRFILKDEIKQLINELRVDSKKTNSYYRSHHSASDNRKSAVSTGLVGVILLFVPIVLFVTFDLMNFFQK